MKKLTYLASLGKALEKNELKSTVAGRVPIGPFTCGGSDAYCKMLYGNHTLCVDNYCHRHN